MFPHCSAEASVAARRRARDDSRRGLAAWAAMLSLLALLLGAATSPLAARQPLAAIVVDARTGKVLHARDADAPRYPASITKVMTIYLLFRELRRGTLTLSSRLRVSRGAAARQPSKLWLKPGTSITVDQAIRALAVKSANDVAAVVAENLAGTESAFAREMTRVARAIGMTRTTFRNASGLPRPKNVSTARDLATLSLRIQRDFPRLYRRYFALRTFRWRGRTHRNHNRLLWRLRGMDGLKTGYTRAAGSNLAASVRRNGRRIVAVVLGASSSRARNAYMTKLVERTFRHHRLRRGTHIAALAGRPPGWRGPTGTRVAAIPPSRLSFRRATGTRQAANPGGARSARQKARATRTARMEGRQALDKLIARAMRQQAEGSARDRTARTPADKAPRPMARPARASGGAKEAGGRMAEGGERGGDAPARKHQRATRAARARSAPDTAALARQDTDESAARARVRVRVAAPGESPAADSDATSETTMPRVDVVIIPKRDAAPAEVARVMVRVRPPETRGENTRPARVAARDERLDDAVRVAPRREDGEIRGDSRPDGARETVDTGVETKATTNEGAETRGWRIVSAHAERAEKLMKTSWNIQIGAFPTPEGARLFLEKARRASAIVRRAVPVTIRVERDGRVFYRARYAGFRRATAARVCRQLKRRGISCLALAPGRG